MNTNREETVFIAEREFRRLRSAMRVTRPQPRRLLKKADEHFPSFCPPITFVSKLRLAFCEPFLIHLLKKFLYFNLFKSAALEHVCALKAAILCEFYRPVESISHVFSFVSVA